MLVRIIKSYRDVVAICDSDLLGKKFEEDNFQLDIKESFFGGEELSEPEAIELMKDMAKEDATFNIVGNNSIKAAIKAGIISKENVGEISKIPYALILL
jgi:hypothetical protein